MVYFPLPVFYYLAPWGLMAIALCIRRLPSNETSEDTYLFMHYKTCYDRLATRLETKKTVEGLYMWDSKDTGTVSKEL
jgi:hypothetical protein